MRGHDAAVGGGDGAGGSSRSSTRGMNLCKNALLVELGFGSLKCLLSNRNTTGRHCFSKLHCMLSLKLEFFVRDKRFKE